MNTKVTKGDLEGHKETFVPLGFAFVTFVFTSFAFLYFTSTTTKLCGGKSKVN